MEKFGLEAEKWMISILRNNGSLVVKSTYEEDHILKIDFWVNYNNSWIPVQFSVDKKAIISWKGKDALQRGIIPMWIDGDKLQIAFECRNGINLVRKFWSLVEQIMKNCSIKRFQNPHWTYV